MSSSAPTAPGAAAAPSAAQTRGGRVVPLVAGFTSGLMSAALLYPLDVVKTRLQAEGNAVHKRLEYHNSWTAARLIARTEGVRGFYMGLSPAVVGAGVAWGSYFFLYEQLKTWLHRRRGTPAGAPLSSADVIVASLLAGAGTLTVTNPIFLIKTRMALQFARRSSAVAAVTAAASAGNAAAHADALRLLQSYTQYTGLFQGLRTVVRTEGVLALYRGFLPGLFGVPHGAVQFVAYERLKHAAREFNAKRDGRHEVYHHQVALIAASSKICATLVTYPAQVIKVRLQDADVRHRSAVVNLVALLRSGGLSGLYRGILPSILRVTPSNAVTLSCYELITRTLHVALNA